MPPESLLPCSAAYGGGAEQAERVEAEGAIPPSGSAPSVTDFASGLKAFGERRATSPANAGEEKKTGNVTLAGAGPGDVDHLTLGALRAIEGAQALLYDALVHPDIIDLAPQRCIRICVGKRGDRLSVSQDKTNALMVRLARRGLNVVRLKGGDPSIFGRVEEERQHLDRHGIAHRTLPGVTAASAAAAQFEFPLTHRGEARSVTFLTGRGLDGNIDFDSGVLRDSRASLAFYMSSHNARHIMDRLLASGRSAATPAVIIENAGAQEARAIAGELGGLADRVAEAGFDGAVLIGVGDAFGYMRHPDEVALPALRTVAHS